jgi:mRNA interferase RelE/StbE
MADYRLEFKKSVSGDLKKIEKSQHGRLLGKAESLASNPFPRNFRKLEGADQLYRIRVGSYRIIYEVDTTVKLVTIYYIRHRKDAY